MVQQVLQLYTMTIIKSIIMRVLFLILFCSPFLSFSQDVIVKKNGDEISSKVIEITDEYIKYKIFDFHDGPIRNIKVTEVFMILYQNGNRENFVNKPKFIRSSIIVEESNSSKNGIIEVAKDEKDDKFLIIGINEKQFVRYDYEGELIDSYFFVFNLPKLEEGLWNPYRNELYTKTGFSLLPKPEQYSKVAYSFVDFEMIKKKIAFIIKDEIEYVFSDSRYLKQAIDDMVAKVLNSMQDNENLEPCTILGITIPVELNPNENIKPKKQKTKLIEFLVIPYIDRNNKKTIRIYNSSKIKKYAFNYNLNLEIGEKDCYLCTKSAMLENIETWYNKEYLLEIKEYLPNKFINFSNY